MDYVRLVVEFPITTNFSLFAPFVACCCFAAARFVGSVCVPPVVDFAAAGRSTGAEIIYPSAETAEGGVGQRAVPVSVSVPFSPERIPAIFWGATSTVSSSCDSLRVSPLSQTVAAVADPLSRDEAWGDSRDAAAAAAGVPPPLAAASQGRAVTTTGTAATTTAAMPSMFGGNIIGKFAAGCLRCRADRTDVEFRS